MSVSCPGGSGRRHMSNGDARLSRGLSGPGISGSRANADLADGNARNPRHIFVRAIRPPESNRREWTKCQPKNRTAKTDRGKHRKYPMLFGCRRVLNPERGPRLTSVLPVRESHGTLLCGGDNREVKTLGTRERRRAPAAHSLSRARARAGGTPGESGRPAKRAQPKRNKILLRTRNTIAIIIVRPRPAPHER